MIYLFCNIKNDVVHFQPFVGCAVYTGTKFFVEGMSKCLRLELEGTEVRVTNVQPGDTDTDIFKDVLDQEVMHCSL